MEDAIRPLREAVTKRLNELSTAYRALARKSRMYNRITIALKALLILFGAFIAAGNTTIAILGNANQTVLVIIGIFIAFLTGLDAWIQPERKTEKLNILAANCRNKKEKVKFRLTEIDTNLSGDDVNVQELALLEDLYQFFEEFQQQAAALRVNVVLELPLLSSQPIANKVKRIR